MKSSIIYLLIEAMVRGIPFLILPFFIKELGKSEFGVLSLYMALLPLMAIGFDLSQRVSIKKFYYDYPRQVDNFIFSIIVSIFITALLIMTILYVFGYKILPNSNMSLVFLNFLLYSLIEQFLTKQQISRNVYGYNVIYFIRNAVPYFFAILLLFSYKQTHLSLVYAQVLVFLLLALYLLFELARKVQITVVINNFKKYLTYSLSIALPVLPAILSAYILAVSDRYMIEYYYGYVEVAEYSLAYTIAMIIQLFVLSLAKVWQPFLFENLKNKKFLHIIVHAGYYCLATIIMILIVYFLSEPIVYFLADEEYAKSIDLIPILLGGMFFFFLYSMLSNVVFFYRRMFLFGLPAILAALCNVCLNYYYLPTHGYEVATWTTLISYLLEFVIIAVIIIYLMKSMKGKQV